MTHTQVCPRQAKPYQGGGIRGHGHTNGCCLFREEALIGYLSLHASTEFGPKLTCKTASHEHYVYGRVSVAAQGKAEYSVGAAAVWCVSYCVCGLCEVRL